MPRLAGSLRLLCCALALPAFAAAQQPPANGHELLQRMHDAYAGTWYRSLTFVQTTTRKTPTGDTVETWYESLRWTPARGGELRIDVGPPSAGNGVLYTPDSVRVMRGGKLVAAREGGNEFIPLIEGVYMQPVDRTERELASTGIDFGRPVLRGTEGGRAVWIAGASAAEDTTSPQIRVDVEHNVVVRTIVPFGPKQPGDAAPPMLDARLEKLVPLAGGWLATKCTFARNGAWIQTEEYNDWKANVELADGLFDAATYASTPHWAATPR
jgi:hypothetical protein